MFVTNLGPNTIESGFWFNLSPTSVTSNMILALSQTSVTNLRVPQVKNRLRF